MTRNYFDKELLKLHRELTEMGRRVDEIMSETLFALKRQDREAARRVVEGDDEIDGMENQIEQMCMNLICRQQPMAGDLRVITATLKLITDVERIADQCSNIGVFTLSMTDERIMNNHHDYIHALHQGKDPLFNRAYQEAHDKYFDELKRIKHGK